MKFLDIGFNNIVYIENIILICKHDSSPIRKMIDKARENNKLIDCSYGKKTKSAIFMNNGNVILSPVLPKTLENRIK